MPKFLFISSGNSKNGVSSIVKSQAESLIKAGVDVDIFTIVGKGIKGYLRNVLPLKNIIKNNRYDLIHSHYSLTAFTASLAGCRPLVVSLMGSDVRLKGVFSLGVKICSFFYWDAVIVKSREMADHIGIRNVEIIPNGIDISLFQPGNKADAAKKLGWNPQKQHILFAANPSRSVKNYELFEKAYQIISMSENCELHCLEDVPHQDVPFYMNASDLVVLTSLWEGSPNVIKEAMACNCPVVATDVGDVAWLFGNEPGHFIAGFDAHDVAEKIKMALNLAKETGKTHGRERIIKLGLDSDSTAKKIIKLYESVLEKKTIK
jgi:glycosyltransferase involved in cell wall biosynthesis